MVLEFWIDLRLYIWTCFGLPPQLELWQTILRLIRDTRTPVETMNLASVLRERLATCTHMSWHGELAIGYSRDTTINLLWVNSQKFNRKRLSYDWNEGPRGNYRSTLTLNIVQAPTAFLFMVSRLVPKGMGVQSPDHSRVSWRSVDNHMEVDPLFPMMCIYISWFASLKQ